MIPSRTGRLPRVCDLDLFIFLKVNSRILQCVLEWGSAQAHVCKYMYTYICVIEVCTHMGMPHALQWREKVMRSSPVSERVDG